MTVQLKPETERLVRDELSRGHFLSVDEMIVEGVRARRGLSHVEATEAKSRKQNLAQFLMESPLVGSGLKVERQTDFPREADL